MLNNKPERIPKSEADQRLGTVATAVNNLALVFGTLETPAPVVEQQPETSYDHAQSVDYSTDPSNQQRLEALAMIQRAFEEQSNEIQ